MNKTLLNIILFLAAAASFLSCNEKTNDESWLFINAPDLHNVEAFCNVWENAWKNDFDSYEAFRKSKIEEQSLKFKHVYETYKAELFVSPGDCNSARWDSRWGTKFRKNFRSVPKYADLSNEEIILEASKLCYTALNEIVYSSGYKEFLMAVGDHEIGDNPWPLGSETPESLPVFRKGFSNYFTLEKPNGKTRFNKSLGNTPSRPIGTIYENTSNAVQYKNILFITLDVFRYDGDDIVLGDQGLICGDITGDHLKWLENVLKEAQNIPSIDHIVVQAHLPIIYPVRKYASSGMMMSGTSDNILLKTMRKYNVDLYLAGEVHMNTVTKDPKSDLIQFVGRGNNLTNYSVVQVESNKLCVKSYKDDGSQLGVLTIDKSNDRKKIAGTGMLKPIDPKGLQVHWAFDDKTDKDDFTSSIGDFPRGNRHIPLTGIESNQFALLNHGELGKAYSLFGENVEIVNGIAGNAIKITDSSKLFAIAIGPMYSDFERTVCCWIKTSAKGRRLILNSNSKWRENGQFFNISLYEGKLELSLRPEITATANELQLSDDNWHHIAVVVPKRNASLSDCTMYVDGKIVNDISYQNGAAKVNTIQSNWMTIATQSDRFKTDLTKTMNMSNYAGILDDFCIWTRALSEEEIEQIVENGKRGMDDREIEGSKY